MIVHVRSMQSQVRLQSMRSTSHAARLIYSMYGTVNVFYAFVHLMRIFCSYMYLVHVLGFYYEDLCYVNELYLQFAPSSCYKV